MAASASLGNPDTSVIWDRPDGVCRVEREMGRGVKYTPLDSGFTLCIACTAECRSPGAAFSVNTAISFLLYMGTHQVTGLEDGGEDGY